MPSSQEHGITLPRFMVDRDLSRALDKQLPDYLNKASEILIFDWSEVLFFDDYTLLKLIFLQRRMRLTGSRVRNTGFLSAGLNIHRQTVLRQLWAVGLPEITASGHLISSEELRNLIEDEAELLESDPLYGLPLPTITMAVIPMLFCHEARHFAVGSREEKQLEAFIRTGFRPSGPRFLAWDLVESREFRHRMLEQLRRNVHEHSRPENGQLGDVR